MCPRFVKNLKISGMKLNYVCRKEAVSDSCLSPGSYSKIGIGKEDNFLLFL